MATNQPTNEPVNQFHLYDIVATEIENTFNPLIEQLIARRDALLTKLQTMKEDFVTHERDNSQSCHRRAEEGDTTDERGKHQS